jgi:hypothetical protein
MRERDAEMSRSSGPAFSPETFIKWLPWGIVGVIVVLGLLISLTAGMPWETKEHANDQRQLIDTQIAALATSVAALTRAQEESAHQIGALTQLMAQFQAAREQEEKDRLKKMSGLERGI